MIINALVNDQISKQTLVIFIHGLPSSKMSTRSTSTSTAAKKKPCGKCDEDCATGNAVVCGFCEFWHHIKCVEGMSPEFVKSCDAMNKYYGGSSFLCTICRKITGMLNSSMRDMEARMLMLENKLKTSELERKCMAAKIENLESRNKQVKENVEKMEGEVASGMVKAKEEVKDEMRDETRKREENKDKIVIYGVEESKDVDGKKRKDEDEEKVKKMMAEIEVEFKGEIGSSYRAGGRAEGDRPRPLVVSIDDDETREGILANARRLSGKAEWKKVFVGPALTWRQREEGRKEVNKLKDEAEKKTQEAITRGDEGKFIVVGQRGRRWLKWIRND